VKAAVIARYRREGVADAAVLLLARRVAPTLTLNDWASHLGVTEVELQAAVARLKARAAARHAPPARGGAKRKRLAPARDLRPNATVPCTVDGCTAMCLDRRGLAAHLRSHEEATCPICGGTFNRAGLGPHKRACGQRGGV
jgi:hypothetical protein